MKVVLLMNDTRGSRFIHVKLTCRADIELAPGRISVLVPWRQDRPLLSKESARRWDPV